MADTVKIRHAGFVYNKKHSTVGTDGKKVTTFHPVMAQRNDVLNVGDMHETDVEKGHEIGAFFDDDKFHPETGVPHGFDIQSGTFSDHQVEMTDDVPDVDEATEAELVEWVKGTTVKAVLELAGDNAEHAALLLQAEQDASGRDPRPTLIAALDKIIGA